MVNVVVGLKRRVMITEHHVKELIHECLRNVEELEEAPE